MTQVVVAVQSTLFSSFRGLDNGVNHIEPGANILLQRQIRRNKLQKSEVVDTTGEHWMAPFSEHLGIVPPEFAAWRELFTVRQPKVLLVEGHTDKEYLEYLRQKLGDKLGLPADLEIVQYGGKDALKNTILVRFMFSKFERVFVTCDLDAIDDVRHSLEQLGLEEGKSFVGVGLRKPGKMAIEGILPERVISAVNGRETDLVMQLGYGKPNEKNQAKSKLKAAYLEEFKRSDDYTDKELQHLIELGKTIGRYFAQ